MLSRRGLFGVFAGVAAVAPNAAKALGDLAKRPDFVEVGAPLFETGFVSPPAPQMFGIPADVIFGGSVTADLVDIGSLALNERYSVEIDAEGNVRGIVWLGDEQFDISGCA